MLVVFTILYNISDGELLISSHANIFDLICQSFALSISGILGLHSNTMEVIPI